MYLRIKEKLQSHEAQYFVLLAIIGVFMMAFCSYTSPAFYFDTSPDNNAFFTVGKAMMHGIVPYKDIFEQKGPYVYFWHGLAYLVSHRSFIFIFISEIAVLIAAMILTYKLARLLKLAELPAFLAAVLSPMLFLYHPYYNYGDTVEFFALPLLLSLIYLVFLLDRQTSVSHWWYFAQGLFVGIIFLSKYTLLGGWIAFYLADGFYLLLKKRWHELGRLVLWSGLGFLLATVPWLLYFLATGSLKAFINVYILFNTKVYMTSSVSFFSNLIQSAILVAHFYLSDVLFFILGIGGTLLIMFRQTVLTTKFARTLYLVVFLGCDLLALYGYQAGSLYQYYQLVYFAFFVVPFIYLLNAFFTWVHLPAADDPFVILGTLILSVFLVLGVNNNVVSSRLFPNNQAITKRNTTKPQQPAQVEFGRIMRQRSAQPTLLNYGSIDMGFYTASGAVPTTYYFQNYNIPEKAAPQILRAQRNVIRRHQVQWVVVNTPAKQSVREWDGDSDIPGRITSGNLNPGTSKLAHQLYRHYRVVKVHRQMFEQVDVKYWLFERKG
ncbi:teichoic acid glycosyl transferase [Levilactobacillus suantsaiihabitans]|uniref:Teichoic acid glycosyl transferase n=1 Tax=Levilactobacillus suantsaiihabitans TaxID=2487722 RepID=A0A4Z0JA97_9LACO|nr:teichoic acid glycosyl transferase [Levilactobacillus suantsaiihabitans]TGD18009.1 teichoic acid glycosyl transferase [Levilactobacillus suantsaiihabitans]